MKNILIGLIASVAVITGLLWLGNRAGSGGTAAIGTTSTLTAPETSFDFGDVSMAAGKVSHDFVIRNDGSAAITAKKLFTSCMCTVAGLTVGDTRVGPFSMPGMGGPIPPIKVEILPGKEGIVRATFDPAAHGPAGVGRIDRVVTLETSDGQLEFKFSANVLP